VDGVNLFHLMVLDTVKDTLDKKGQQETLAIIKRVSIKEEVRKVYLKAFFQEIKRREN